MADVWSWVLWAADGLWSVLRWQARVIPRLTLGYVVGVFVLSVASVPVTIALGWQPMPALAAVCVGLGAWMVGRYAHRAWMVWKRGR